MLTPARRLLKIFHPEGIPWLGTIVYNAVSQSDIFQRLYELIAEDIARYGSGGRLVDVGTGPGWLLLKLHRTSPAWRAIGMDISPPMVDRARRNVSDAGLSAVIDVMAGNASDMPFGDDSLDLVVSTGSVHHWKKPGGALREIYRVLKPGGYALLYDLVSDTPASVLNEVGREFGRLKMLLLWLHSFEEPFHSCESFGSLARDTPFTKLDARFVGVMCCLALRKQGVSETSG